MSMVDELQKRIRTLEQKHAELHTAYDAMCNEVVKAKAERDEAAGSSAPSSAEGHAPDPGAERYTGRMGCRCDFPGCVNEREIAKRFCALHRETDPTRDFALARAREEGRREGIEEERGAAYHWIRHETGIPLAPTVAKNLADRFLADRVRSLTSRGGGSRKGRWTMSAHMPDCKYDHAAKGYVLPVPKGCAAPEEHTAPAPEQATATRVSEGDLRDFIKGEDWYAAAPASPPVPATLSPEQSRDAAAFRALTRPAPPEPDVEDPDYGFDAPAAPVPATLTMIVNGTPREIPFAPGETVGVLAHRALAADDYGWTHYELRDEAGSLLMERTPAVAGETVYIAKPIGWGG